MTKRSSPFSYRDIQFFKVLVKNRCDLEEIALKLSDRLGRPISRHTVAALCSGNRVRLLTGRR
jgi:hypothetical protein